LANDKMNTLLYYFDEMIVFNGEKLEQVLTLIIAWIIIT